ncbi:hypothetical protein DM01DRAFT_1406351 [Hesseltinella vesiculosa]|uniref:RING-type E3 ubiquitin transferase n=1 Tax=Hesseltinella vesiculosa TaxID=101127 RepID=A0A1X2GLS9_9FUNG|nr:hypothetical protein DM01DRAFT_1406351 [Hesseltinella vesiculosa]
MVPKGWIQIVSPSQHDHVLTVVGSSFEPLTRVELLPNVKGHHQQWTYDAYGYLINRHSGCVLMVKSVSKKSSVAKQQVIQGQRQDVAQGHQQQWEIIEQEQDQLLRLKALSAVMIRYTFTFLVLFVTCLVQRCQGTITVVATNETLIDRIAAFGPRMPDTVDGLVGYLSPPADHNMRHGCEVMAAPCDNWIAFVERGNCSFIDKVRSMQKSGAIAVVVGDNYYNGWVTMYAPGDTSDVHIPSVFVAQRQYHVLADLLDAYGDPLQVRLEKDDIFTWPLLDMLLVVVLSPAVMMIFIYTTWRMRQRQRQKEDLAPTDFVTNLPARSFKKLDKEHPDDNAHDECAICLEDYVDDDLLRVLPCKHEFHTRCVDAWLTGHKKFCPVCKHDVCHKDVNENTPLLLVP